MESPTSSNLEEKVAEWTEPSLGSQALSRQLFASVILGAVVLAAILGIIGYFQEDFTYYLASVAVLIAGVVIIVQKKRPTTPQSILLTTARLQVGSHTYSLGDIAGFWLEPDGDYLLVNVELQKATMFPITFLYPSLNSDEARTMLLQVMPEVEARQKSLADTISRYIRL